jgi:hypothetical protein
MVTIEFARTNGSAEYNPFTDSLRKFARSSRTKGRPSKQGRQLLRYVYPKRLLGGRARAYSLGYQRQTLTFRKGKEYELAISPEHANGNIDQLTKGQERDRVEMHGKSVVYRICRRSQMNPNRCQHKTHPYPKAS